MVGVVPLRPSRVGKSEKGPHAGRGPRVAQPWCRVQELKEYGGGRSPAAQQSRQVGEGAAGCPALV